MSSMIHPAKLKLEKLAMLVERGTPGQRVVYDRVLVEWHEAHRMSERTMLDRTLRNIRILEISERVEGIYRDWAFL